MARTDTLDHFLTDVADAIRTKGGTQALINADNFDTAIGSLPSGGAAPNFVSFYNAPAGTDISWLTDTSNLTSCKSMFYNSAITGQLDISSWDLTSVTDISGMCSYAAFSKILMPGCAIPAISAGNFIGNNSNLTEVVFPSGCSFPNLRQCNSMFGAYITAMPLLTTLDLSNITIPSATNCSQMFRGLSTLTTLKLPQNFGENVTNMQYMFSGCSGITTIDNLFTVDNVSTNKYDMSQMFDGCSGLTTLDLSHLKGTARTMQDCFRECSSLTSIDLSNLQTVANISLNSCFYKCTSLQHLDLRSAYLYSSTGSNVFGNESDSTTCVPNNCEIIVMDDTSKSWLTNNYPRFTNVKTVAEL